MIHQIKILSHKKEIRYNTVETMKFKNMKANTKLHFPH